MSSGIVQLVAIGAQDEFIMGNPEISFFNSKFKRHSNFSQSVEKQTIRGDVKNNSMSSVQIEKSGDMLGYMYMTIDDGVEAVDTSRWDLVIDKIELLIGGSVIDTQDSIFTEKIAIDTFAQNVSRSAIGTHPGVHARSFFYPLRFFMCEGPQSALPLVALNYHNVELRIYWGSQASNYNIEFFANYYYLDNEERGNMATRTHDMLITQVQKSVPSGENVQELIFNHPVKYLASSDTSVDGALTSPRNKLKLSINGVELSNFKWGRPHFMDVTNYYHTNFVTSPDFFLYCFCLITSSLQPTGSLNFSRVESAKLMSESLPINDPIYAVSYNILRVQNGLAALLYAN
jgi:hypothetical protein|uniref:Major capsid protein N-terminal domain-containing protein n=1 Tax=viral metagenome TaxID=1070528 RepID=A0A6C0JFP0_9ZZZZ